MDVRIHIDGEWNAADFAAFYNSLDKLYGFFLERMMPPVEFGRMYAFTRYTGFYESRFELSVTKVQFSSPGFTDLAGIAAAMRELRELIQYLIKFVSEREDRALSRDRARLEITVAKVELLHRLLAIEEEYGSKISPLAQPLLGLRRGDLPDIDPLISAVLEGRVTAVSSHGAEDNQ